MIVSLVPVCVCSSIVACSFALLDVGIEAPICVRLLKLALLRCLIVCFVCWLYYFLVLLFILRAAIQGSLLFVFEFQWKETKPEGFKDDASTVQKRRTGIAKLQRLIQSDIELKNKLTQRVKKQASDEAYHDPRTRSRH